MTEDQSLFQSFTLGEVPIRNRVVMAPLTRARAGKDRIPNALMARYYTQRASAGLIISEATSISRQGIGWVENPGIFSDAQVAGWRPIVESVREAGGAMFLQLWHCGRASHSSFHNGDLPVAPSAVKLEGMEAHTPVGKQPYETPRALETEEVAEIVADYKRAAERAKDAGFDGVEIHSANGYLLDQFLQSKTNRREDRYGGSVENRYRLLDEVVTAVTSVFPAGRVGVRLSPNGNFNDMGSPDFRETFSYAAQQLDRFGLSYLHVVDGLGFGFHELGEPMTLAEFRKLYRGPLMGNCGYDQGKAAAAIARGDADAIAFGRPFISNPDLVDRFRNGWPLAPDADMSVWYSTEPEGYADFPTYPQAEGSQA